MKVNTVVDVCVVNLLVHLDIHNASASMAPPIFKIPYLTIWKYFGQLQCVSNLSLWIIFYHIQLSQFNHIKIPHPDVTIAGTTTPNPVPVTNFMSVTSKEWKVQDVHMKEVTKHVVNFIAHTHQHLSIVGDP